MTIKFSEELVEHTYWIEQTAQLSDLTITLGKSKKALSDSAEFLPNKVMKGDTVLWQFEKSYINYLAFLREVDGEYLIVYATKGEVVDIVPIRDLPNAIRLADGQYDWQRSVKDRLSLKIAVSKGMAREARLTPIEKILKGRIDEEQRAAAAAKSAAAATERQADHEARLAARTERKRLIMMRERIRVYTAAGEGKSGVPVVDDEWQALGNGVDCILVTDATTNNPIEHFFVKVEGSRKSRQRIIAVFAEDPTKPKLAEKMGEVVVEVNGEPDVVSCYTRDGLKELQKYGLNSGAIRAVWPANSDGSHTLVSFSKGNIKDIGNFQPLT